jgi:hypothetical protein
LDAFGTFAGAGGTAVVCWILMTTRRTTRTLLLLMMMRKRKMLHHSRVVALSDKELSKEVGRRSYTGAMVMLCFEVLVVVELIYTTTTTTTRSMLMLLEPMRDEWKAFSFCRAPFDSSTLCDAVMAVVDNSI